MPSSTPDHDQPSPVASRAADVASTAGTTARATGVVALGMVTMNALAYAFTLYAAHALGPDAFGGVSALLGVLIVAAVGMVAVQATGARRLAVAAPEHQQAVTRDILLGSLKVTAVLGVALLALAPLINAALHIDDLVTSSMVAVCTVPATMLGAYAGITQGQRRWTVLALIYAGLGIGRLAAGVVAMQIDPTMRAAMIGLAVGTLVPFAIGMATTRWPKATQDSDHAPVVRELWRNGHTLLAFFVFTNLDVLLARHLFDADQAGIYAAGAILAKTCLFLPTFVLVVAFPSMATDRTGRPWLKPMLAVLGLGALAVAAAWLLPDLAVTFAGGDEYAQLGDVAWLFALEGTMFAALQILVYDTIAGQSHASLVLWLASAVVAGVAIPLIGGMTGLVTLVTVVAVVAALVTGLVPRASDAD